MPSQTLSQFRRDIWEALPEKKHMAGKEKIFDVVSILIQEWPDEDFDSSKKNKAKSIRTALRLNRTVKRQMHLMYGEEEFGFLWALALNVLVSMIIRMILDWWMKRDENRQLLSKWRNRRAKER